MTNRKLDIIVRNQHPLTLGLTETVDRACKAMWKLETGSVLVVDAAGHLAGIFTGRDAVRLIAERAEALSVPLAEAMTAGPVCVAPTARALDALRAMHLGDFRHVPVVDGERICGVVSRGDLKGMELEQALRAELGKGAHSPTNRTLGEMIAGRAPVTVADGASVRDACRMMRDARASSVLVVDGAERLVGIFTGRDAVRVAGDGKDAGATRLDGVMTREPQSMPPEASAIDALRALCEGGFRHMPVVADGRVLGMVTRSDFSGAEVDRLDEEEHLRECIW